MKITSQAGITPISQNNYKPRPSTHEEATAVETSTVSSTAQLLSKNLSKLNNQLSEREEIIQRFSGSLTDPVKLQDRTIDLIIQRLKTT